MTCNYNLLFPFSYCITLRDIVTVSLNRPEALIMIHRLQTAEICSIFNMHCGLPLLESLYHSLDANIFDSFGIRPSKISFDRRVLIRQCTEEVL